VLIDFVFVAPASSTIFSVTASAVVPPLITTHSARAWWVLPKIVALEIWVVVEHV